VRRHVVLVNQAVVLDRFQGAQFSSSPATRSGAGDMALADRHPM
jgi:hypothetical protein